MIVAEILVAGFISMNLPRIGNVPILYLINSVIILVLNFWVSTYCFHSLTIHAPHTYFYFSIILKNIDRLDTNHLEEVALQS